MKPSAETGIADLERSLAEWRRVRDDARLGAPAPKWALRHPKALAAALARLRVGPPPDEVHAAIAQAWQPFTEAWASTPTLEALETALRGVDATLAANEEGLKSRHGELELRRERVAMLRTLAEIFDELLRSSDAADPEPCSEDPR